MWSRNQIKYGTLALSLLLWGFFSIVEYRVLPEEEKPDIIIVAPLFGAGAMFIVLVAAVIVAMSAFIAYTLIEWMYDQSQSSKV